MLSELDEKRVSASISLAESEKAEIKNMANKYGLFLSEFLRFAAKEFATKHAKTLNTGN